MAVERGQSLLSRSSKTKRADKTLTTAPNDSSATAVPTTITTTTVDSGVYQDGRSGNRSAHSPSISSPTKLASGKKNANSSANYADHPHHQQHLNERRMSDSAVASQSRSSFSGVNRRRTKLVRNPRNTQSIDVDRSAYARERRPRPGFFAQLFSCCTPVSLFSRSPSYGTMQDDANCPHGEGREAADRASSASASGGQRRHQLQQGEAQKDEQQGQGQGRQSVADTAVAGESGGDDSNATPKIGPTAERDPASTADALEGDENDWLISRPKTTTTTASSTAQQQQTASTEDYSSAGSGLAGGVSGLPAHEEITAAAAAAPHGTSSTGTSHHLAPFSAATTQQTSEFATYNTAYSDHDTDAGVSSLGNSVYRTPPTSVGDFTNASNSTYMRGLNRTQDDLHEEHEEHEEHVGLGQGTPSETPANTISKIYMHTQGTARISRQLTQESSADHDSFDDDDIDSEEENDLRAEITSPPGNIATESSERLVTHVINQYLLPPIAPHLKGKKCLVLDLDETLVHSSFREVDQPDYIVPVVLEGQEHNVYVVKRPGVDEFMRIMGQYYEVVVFTASLSMYADPVLDLLDKSRVVHHRLFRESCNLYNGNYVKDLSRLGRDITQSIIIDNSPASYAFHPNNAIGISTWLNDLMDTELRDLIPFLIDLTKVDDVSAVLSITHNHPS